MRHAVGAQQFHFGQKLFLYLFRLFRRGAGVECKITGREPDEVLSADIVGQAQFVTHADEQARTQIAARFLKQFQGVPVLRFQCGAVETHDEHGLFLIAGFRDAPGRVERRGLRVESPHRFPIGYPTRKGLFHGGVDVGGLHITVDGEHAVIGHDQFAIKGFQVGRLEFADGFFRAEQIEAVAGVAEERAAHGNSGAFEQLILLRADAGDLDLAFALQF